MLGYDIDKYAIQQCRQKLSKLNDNPFPVFLQCCNFLELSKDEFVSHIHQESFISDLKKTKIIFIGGPPYSSGVGSGEAIDRDLPSQFVMHSIHNIGADFVSFILPIRCNNMVNDLQEQINARCKNCLWSCTIYNLTSSEFLFIDQVVTQPSVIHCWVKNYC